MPEKIEALELVQQASGRYFVILEGPTGRFIFELEDLKQTDEGKSFKIKRVNESGIDGVTPSGTLSYSRSDIGLVVIRTLLIPVNYNQVNRLRLGAIPYQINQDKVERLDNNPATGDLTTRFLFIEPVTVSVNF